jgi:hypothetical protein
MKNLISSLTYYQHHFEYCQYSNETDLKLNPYCQNIPQLSEALSRFRLEGLWDLGWKFFLV